MVATVPNTGSTTANLRLIANNVELGKKFPKEVIPYLLKACCEADAKMKNDIENKIVMIGDKAVEELVKAIENESGVARSVAIMSVIRIGKSSVSVIKKSNLGWLGDYIINEIEGSRIPLSRNKRKVFAV